MKRIASLLFLCLYAGCISLFAQTAAKIISVQGRIEIKKSGTVPWLPVSGYPLLDEGDAIRTLAQSRAVLLLADETQMKLNANTTLELRGVRRSSSLMGRIVQTSAQGERSRLNVPAGEVWLRSKLKPANVIINTPAVTAAIRGTEFDLRVADDGESVLTLLEGLVDFRNDQGAVLLAEGEQGRARIGQAPTKSLILRPRDAVQWVLYYPGTISPADYPFLNQSRAQLQATLAAARTRRESAPADTSNLLLLGRAHHDLGQKSEAEGVLKVVLSTDPANIEASTDLAWLYLEQNRYQDAIEQLKKVDPPTDRALTALAMAYYRQGDAISFFDIIHKTDPGKSSLAATQRAFADLLYGDVNEARSLLDKVAPGDPNYSLAQGLLSNVYLAQNEKDQARASAERAVSSGPQSPSAYLNLSLVQQSSFQLPEALQSARRALELDPDYLAAQIQVAKLLFALGDTARAEQIVRQGLARNGSEAALNSLFGFILLAQAKTQTAKSYFEKSIAVDSTRAEPYLGLGIVAMRQGRTIDAAQAFLIATTLEPQLSIYQSYLGKAFYNNRRFEMAFDALSNASTLDDKDPTPHLYAGIFHNDLNRPVQAVREFTKSIELNNNRAVYRSRFLLDQDLATRNVNLATAYNRLYLYNWGNFEALKSQMADPTNSSAHIFLGQTFLNLRGRTQAAGSEQLLARTLSPVNANSFNSFNDYTTLFEQPQARWTNTGQFGSFSAYTAGLVASGGGQRATYGLQVTRFTTDGFRPLNDDVSSYDVVAQAKLALTPHSDLLFLYSHGQQNGGDSASGLISDDNNPYRRQFTRRNRGEIGYHRRLRPGSDVVVYFSGEKFDSVSDDPHYFPNLFNAGYQAGLRSASRAPDLNLQATHLYKVGPLQVRYGLDIFEGRKRDRRTYPCCLPLFDTDFGETLELRNIRYKNAYVQTDYLLHPRLVLTGGVHYDWSSDNNLEKDPELPRQPLQKWSPQAGIFYTPFDSTALRFAFVRSLQTHFRERLAPTNIDGFAITQNDRELSQNKGFSFGWDQRLFQSSFFRTTAFYRDRDTPVLAEGDEGFVPTTVLDHFHGADFVWEQLVGEHFSVAPQYSVIRSEESNAIRHQHDAALKIFYISPLRYWISVSENYIRQRGRFATSRLAANFFTTDLNASWELPRKRGLISFGVVNLFDHNYVLIVDPLALDPRVPRRQFTGSIRFNY